MRKMMEQRNTKIMQSNKLQSIPETVTPLSKVSDKLTVNKLLTFYET